jgi:hypothetical protein
MSETRKIKATITRVSPPRPPRAPRPEHVVNELRFSADHCRAGQILYFRAKPNVLYVYMARDLDNGFYIVDRQSLENNEEGRIENLSKNDFWGSYPTAVFRLGMP